MAEPNISVRVLNHQDIEGVVQYWMTATDDHLRGMGADPSKLPDAAGFRSMLQSQVDLPNKGKSSFCLIWVLDGKAVGHNNINKINYGLDASMHLHLWAGGLRQKGLGLQFLKHSIPEFFKEYQLQTLICEPYAMNPAPNRVLEKLGFTFERKYTTIPGNINFEQEVNRWTLTLDQMKALFM